MFPDRLSGWLKGADREYPLKAGHSVASIAYRAGLISSPRPGQVIDLRSYRLKEVWELPSEKP
jgi:hypothetical protein